MAALVEVIAPDCRVLVLDNGHDEPLFTMEADVVDTRGMGLYEQWNLGVRLAREAGATDIAILNDDIRILPLTMRRLAQALRSDPTVGCVYPNRQIPLSSGIQRNGAMMVLRDPIDARDMTGYCFMFKAELDLPPFDEGYTWWYADTQFDEAVKLAGYGVARVDGVPIEHVSDAETDDWARRPELKEAVQRDGVRWADLHDRIEDGRWVPR